MSKKKTPQAPQTSNTNQSVAERISARKEKREASMKIGLKAKHQKHGKS